VRESVVRSEQAKALSGPFRVLIVEDHPVVVGGLTAMIDSRADFEVCGVSDHAGEALELIEQEKPAVAVVDLSLRDSDGMDLIRAARARGHRLPLLVLSSHHQAVYAQRALQAGANGYVNKADLLSTVIEALRQVLDGKIFISATIRDEVLRHTRATDPIDDLSLRELEIFRLIGEGRTTRRIAAILNVSISTVESHHRNIRTKLGLESSRDLVQYAARWGVPRDGKS
jgi:DNA-binding NarL/FixJ family response regulator